LLASQFDDVDSYGGMGKRLELVSALCSYFVEYGAPLNAEWVGQIWNVLFVGNSPQQSPLSSSLSSPLSSSSSSSQRHRLACLRWLTVVLRPKELQRDVVYFAPTPGSVTSGNMHASMEAERARAWVLEQLSEAVVQGSAGGGGAGAAGGAKFDLCALGKDAVECLLSLFIWVNKDKGSLKEVDELGNGGGGGGGANAPFVFGANAHALPPLSTTGTTSSYPSSVATQSSSGGGGGLTLAKVAASLFAGLGVPEASIAGLSVKSFDAAFDGEIAVMGEEIVSFEAVTVAALDSVVAASTALSSSSAATTPTNASSASPTSTTAAGSSSLSPSSTSEEGTADAAAQAAAAAAAAVVSASDAATGAVWASQTLLAVSDAVLKARRTRLVGSQGLARYDLVEVLMARIEKLSPLVSSGAAAAGSVAVADPLGNNDNSNQQQQQRSLEHCLGVLCAYLKQTADLCATPAHQARSLGTSQLVLQVSLDPALAAAAAAAAAALSPSSAAAGASMAMSDASTGTEDGEQEGGAGASSAALTQTEEALAVHNNTPLADVVARAVAALAPSGGGGDVGLSNEDGERFTWCLRPVLAATAAAAAASAASRANKNVDNNNNTVNNNNNFVVFSSDGNATLKGLAKTVRHCRCH
jgi:hypothetical protein